MAAFGYKKLSTGGNDFIQVNMESNKNGSNLDVVVYIADKSSFYYGMSVRVDVVLTLQRRVSGVWNDIGTFTGYAADNPYGAGSPMRRTFTNIKSTSSPIRAIATLKHEGKTYAGTLTALPLHYFG